MIHPRRSNLVRRGLRLALGLALLIGLLVPATVSQGAVYDAAADSVLGQLDFGLWTANQGNSLPTASSLFTPNASAVAPDGTFAVADSSNNRVTIYASASRFAKGESAIAVLGQANTTSNSPAGGQTGLNYPVGVAFDSAGHLWVADGGNNRIVGYNPPFSTGMQATMLIGQTGWNYYPPNGGGSTPNAQGLAMPNGLAFDPAGNLWVADTANNRLVRFPLVPDGLPGQLAATADRVLGQPSLTTGAANGGTGAVGPTGLDGPLFLAFDPSGSLWVSDQSNNRVLRYSQPLATSSPADRVVGQSTFTTKTANAPSGTVNANGLYQPIGVAFDGSGRLYVGDSINNRVVVYDPGVVNGGAASRVIGQADLTHSGVGTAGSASGLYTPYGVTVDAAQNVYVADYNDNRVLRYDVPFAPPSGITLSLSPGSQTVSVNDVFSVGIVLSSGAVQTDGVSAYLDFDPTALQVVDASGNPTNKIQDPQTPFETELQNLADNAFGRINYSVGSLTNPKPSGTNTVGTIRFKALKSGAATVAFVSDPGHNRKTDVTAAGNSLLTGTTGGSYTVVDVTVTGHVGLQGRDSNSPPTAYTVPLALDITPAGSNSPTISTTVTLDQSGNFVVRGLSPNTTYTFRVKNRHTLANLRSGVSIVTGTNTVDLCTLQEGDADNNNQVNITDFSILSAAYDSVAGGPRWDSRADFNESGQVNIADFSLLPATFGRYGDQPCTAPAGLAASPSATSPTSAVAGAPSNPSSAQVQSGGASTVKKSQGLQLQLNPANSSLQVGQVATITMQVAAGSQPLDGVGAYLKFDPQYLQVVDASGQPATSLEGASSPLETGLANAVDNSQGQIRFSAGSLGSAKPTGTFTVATIRVKALRSTPKNGTAIAFVFDQSSNRNTNVVLAGQSVLAGSQNAIVKVTSR